MKKVFVIIIIILQINQLFSQRAGLPPYHPESNGTSRLFIKEDYVSAKFSSDMVFAFYRENDLLTSKNWFYRGMIYQKFYEDFDTLNESFENKYFRNILETDIKRIFGRLTKDTTLKITIKSYLKFICMDVISDTLDFYKITNDSIYRINKFEKFNSFEFASNKYVTPLIDTILPQILEYLAMKTFSLSEEDKVYAEIFWGIIEDTRQIE